VEDLDRWLAGESVAARRGWSAGRRLRAGAVALASVVAGGVALAALAAQAPTTPPPPARPPPPVAPSMSPVPAEGDGSSEPHRVPEGQTYLSRLRRSDTPDAAVALALTHRDLPLIRTPVDLEVEAALEVSDPETHYREVLSLEPGPRRAHLLAALALRIDATSVERARRLGNDEALRNALVASVDRLDGAQAALAGEYDAAARRLLILARDLRELDARAWPSPTDLDDVLTRARVVGQVLEAGPLVRAVSSLGQRVLYRASRRTARAGRRARDRNAELVALSPESPLGRALSVSSAWGFQDRVEADPTWLDQLDPILLDELTARVVAARDFAPEGAMSDLLHDLARRHEPASPRLSLALGRIELDAMWQWLQVGGRPLDSEAERALALLRTAHAEARSRPRSRLAPGESATALFSALLLTGRVSEASELASETTSPSLARAEVALVRGDADTAHRLLEDDSDTWKGQDFFTTAAHAAHLVGDISRYRDHMPRARRHHRPYDQLLGLPWRAPDATEAAIRGELWWPGADAYR